MPNKARNRAPQYHIDTLSRLLFHGYSTNFEQPRDTLEATLPALGYVSNLDGEEFAQFLQLAAVNHVSVRALAVLRKAAQVQGDCELENRLAGALADERAQAERAIAQLDPICQELESQGLKATVIKSLDHWPDIGSDLDLYTTGDAQAVTRVMRTTFHARLAARSWGDRLANKWNFMIPGLAKLIEIHVRYLGQTGEHRRIAARVVERRVGKSVTGHTFYVPAPEERILISTLQRMYRHFYFRLCDMVDTAALIETGSVNFARLRESAEMGGIWPGVTSFLLIVSKYLRSYGRELALPDKVIQSAPSNNFELYFEKQFWRLRKLPAVHLYTSQFLNAGRHGDWRALSRLPLLPPLAVSAIIAYRLTHSDKGVW